MKKRISIYLYLINIIIFISCCGQNAHKNVSKLSDTLVREIPLAKMPRYKGEPAYFYSLKKEFEKELNLNSIEIGFDSIYIRAWFSESRTDTMKLFEFWYTKGEWNGKQIFFRNPGLKEITKLYPDVKTPDSFKVEQSLSLAQSKWEDFTRSIFSLGISSLPDYQDIPNYFPDADGKSYMFEVATKKRYRLYSYNNPAFFKNEFWQADKVNQIVLLIQNIFNQLKPIN